MGKPVGYAAIREATGTVAEIGDGPDFMEFWIEQGPLRRIKLVPLYSEQQIRSALERVRAKYVATEPSGEPYFGEDSAVNDALDALLHELLEGE